jgi:hypothetical protein
MTPIMLILRFLRVLPVPSDANSKLNKPEHKVPEKVGFFYAVAVFTLAAIVFIVDTELMIKRSSDLVKDGEAQWSFGQTLAMFMTVLPLIEAARGLWLSYNEKRANSMKPTTSMLRTAHSQHNIQLIPYNDSPHTF